MVLVTAIGNLGGDMRQCHQEACGNFDNLNREDNKEFLAISHIFREIKLKLSIIIINNII